MLRVADLHGERLIDGWLELLFALHVLDCNELLTIFLWPALPASRPAAAAASGRPPLPDSAAQKILMPTMQQLQQMGMPMLMSQHAGGLALAAGGGGGGSGPTQVTSLPMALAANQALAAASAAAARNTAAGMMQQHTVGAGTGAALQMPALQFTMADFQPAFAAAAASVAPEAGPDQQASPAEQLLEEAAVGGLPGGSGLQEPQQQDPAAVAEAAALADAAPVESHAAAAAPLASGQQQQHQQHQEQQEQQPQPLAAEGIALPSAPAQAMGLLPLLPSGQIAAHG